MVCESAQTGSHTDLLCLRQTAYYPSQVLPFSQSWPRERGPLQILLKCGLSKGGAGTAVLSQLGGGGGGGKEASDIFSKLQEEANRMQGPELAFGQDNGINFPSAGQKGPWDFYFYSFSITTAQQRKQGPKQGEWPWSHFPSWGGISMPHILMTLAHPRFKVERWITSLCRDNGKEA